MLVRPCPPAPMIATLTLSLGATKRGPPRTCRGTMVKAAAAAAVVAMNSRRVGCRLGVHVRPLIDGGAEAPPPRMSSAPHDRPTRRQFCQTPKPCARSHAASFDSMKARDRERQARESFHQVEAQPYAVCRGRSGPTASRPDAGRTASRASGPSCLCRDTPRSCRDSVSGRRPSAERHDRARWRRCCSGRGTRTAGTASRTG